MQGNYTPKWFDRFFVKVDANGDCWEWTAYIAPNGYGRFQIHPFVHNAHRLLYEWLVGPVPEGLELDHLCRIRHCVNPDHLEPVPHRVNVLRGDVTRTAQLKKRKLTAADVLVIRQRYAQGGTSLRILGREYDVSYKAIQAIVRRKTYRHVA